MTSLLIDVAQLTEDDLRGLGVFATMGTIKELRAWLEKKADQHAALLSSPRAPDELKAGDPCPRCIATLRLKKGDANAWCYNCGWFPEPRAAETKPVTGTDFEKLRQRIAYFRGMGETYFEGPLKLEELEVLLRAASRTRHRLEQMRDHWLLLAAGHDAEPQSNHAVARAYRMAANELGAYLCTGEQPPTTNEVSTEVSVSSSAAEPTTERERR